MLIRRSIAVERARNALQTSILQLQHLKPHKEELLCPVPQLSVFAYTVLNLFQKAQCVKTKRIHLLQQTRQNLIGKQQILQTLHDRHSLIHNKHMRVAQRTKLHQISPGQNQYQKKHTDSQKILQLSRIITKHHVQGAFRQENLSKITARKLAKNRSIRLCPLSKNSSDRYRDCRRTNS